MIRARHLEGQTEQAWCLTLATNAVIAWTTEYYGLAVEQMRREGRRIDDDVLAHISPAHSEHQRLRRDRGSTLTPNSPNSVAPVTGHCVCATPCSDLAKELVGNSQRLARSMRLARSACGGSPSSPAEPSR
jgi:hypothetical protein